MERLLHRDDVDLQAPVTPELTRMQLLALKMTGDGLSVDAIGTVLGLCRREVEVLLEEAQTGLAARNRFHAVSIAASRRLIGILP